MLISQLVTLSTVILSKVGLCVVPRFVPARLYGCTVRVGTAWDGIAARHGFPRVRIADGELAGVTCIRLDATVTEAHSDK